ncbi:MAG: ABC transporter ATP-binding protein, partial [Gemmataceae bacterium]|nr:ABC transporter ATP-binding protein [Gemmataceae bacterium]
MSHALTARFAKRFSETTSVAVELSLPAEGFSVAVLFGPSGCGKTTVLRCLAGLERPDEGRIDFRDETWFDAASGCHLSPQRRDIGYLFQDYALFPHLTVWDNVAYGLRGIPASERRQRVESVLELLGLRGLDHRYPRQLSGGEQQRVALARVLVRRPRLLLLDEPLSAVDGPTRDRLRSELRGWLSRFGVPVILVTHDRVEAASLADRLLVLHQGRVIQSGDPIEVFSQPISPDVARVVGIETVLAGEVVETADESGDGGATVAIGPVRLRSSRCTRLRRPSSVPIRVHVAIRAEAVGLSPQPLPNSVGSSTQPPPNAVGLSPQPPPHANLLPAKIVGVQAEGAMVRVELDCGFPLIARFTIREWSSLGVTVGTALSAWID